MGTLKDALKCSCIFPLRVPVSFTHVVREMSKSALTECEKVRGRKWRFCRRLLVLFLTLMFCGENHMFPSESFGECNRKYINVCGSACDFTAKL